MAWKQPSERVRELMRQAAQLSVNIPEEWLDQIHEATIASEYMQVIIDDPVLTEQIRRSNQSNRLHWIAANISHPGEPVPVNLGTESLGIARDLIRRGFTEAAVVDAYRLSQNALWRLWMQVVFELTADPAELRELLDVSAQSIGAFADATLGAIHRQLQIERAELIRGTHAERREVVALLIDGAPITRQHAERRLGYRLDQDHTAVIIWGDESGTDWPDLDRAAETLMRTVADRRPLSLPADAGTRWLWLPGPLGPDPADVGAMVDSLPGVRVAIGSTEAGVEGFRRSHLDAITTQRMVARLGSGQRVARFADVELVSLITADPARADRFLKHTLGDFETADAELHRTVHTFIAERCNAARAAATLFVHRNTLLNRLARAEALLPQPLASASAHIAVALEVLRWRSAAVQPDSADAG
ncbi:PucR family transcriptional regulator [Mycolicibacter kumamotonensis]|uniref:PucR family transcriptional regulator n=1 Tax=Mycolicibacter kumamotonensis TaxID=354243 RepID=A0A7K3LFE9_9MYCO|nr:PucR family transcriptional regulator [Mycolicibacter kumamotonensis]NDJ91094.1 PucR family transcriptional regulator [Mycolicibacter kumamotonensis]